MALKLTAGAWIAASEENRVQRNSERDRFFAESGASPAGSLRDIHLAPAARIQRLSEMIDHLRSPRIDDKGLVEIAQLAMSGLAIVGLGVPLNPMHLELRSLGLTAFAPEVLNSFFNTEIETALSRSLF